MELQPVLNGIRAWTACMLLYATGTVFRVVHIAISRLLHLYQPSRPSPLPASQSVVLIIGADGDQANIALRLSEHGYTVFLVFDPKFGSEDSIEIPRLLHSWHLRKLEGPDKIWGLIVPMTANIHLTTDRRRVCETIEAYCSQHLLNLSTVIYLPTTSFAKESDFLLRSRRLSSDHSLDIDRVQKSIRDDVIGVYVSLNDYLPMLSKASGRVIVLSEETCFDSGFREATSSALHGELDPFGIDVVSIVSGPRRPRPLSPSSAIIIESKLQRFTSVVQHLQDRIRHSHRWLLDSFYVSEEEFLENIQTAVQAVHPMRRQYIGSYPFVKTIIAQQPWLMNYVL